MFANIMGVPLSAQAAEELKIAVIEGDGFINNIRKSTARDPVVEVRDRNNKPIAGAAVTFLLPSSGPSGTFSNGAQSITVQTNQAGRAVAQGFRPNQVAGEFRIQVEAKYQNQTGRASIRQRNISRTPWLSAKRLLLIGGVAAVAATVAIVATRGGNSTSVGLGTPTVEAPR
ncbi:MAG: hypothetical protein IT168_19870 [Bryobacterales bacterium]|nr:hypothetical protein [Bryobacterales bacterium]